MAQQLKPIEEKPSENALNKGIEKGRAVKKRVVKGIINHASVFIGVFLIFVVIVVFTTDIKFSSLAEFAGLGLAFFVLLFCSYSMYVNFADSGTRAGKNSDAYIETYNDYIKEKQAIMNDGTQNRLLEFCRYFIKQEQENTRRNILADVGLNFATYSAKYISMGRTELSKESSLTKSQKAAIIRANKVKPIRLTPEMFFKCGRQSGGRAPLGTSPQTKKAIAYSTRFVKTALTALATTVIVLEVVVEPNWATFAACCLKLLTVILSGFTGYKMGYENIVFDAVNYMSDQTDLMQQFKQYVADHPNTVEEASENRVVETDAVAELPQNT